MHVAGWFEGLRTEDLVAGARWCLGRRHSILLEGWGLRSVDLSDGEFPSRVELGERVVHDLRRENDGDRCDREDWVIRKAFSAAPGCAFLDLITSDARTAPDLPRVIRSGSPLPRPAAPPTPARATRRAPAGGGRRRASPTSPGGL